MQETREVHNLAEVPRPCDVFDMIGGTSTGGQASQIQFSMQRLTLELQNHCNNAREAGYDGGSLPEGISSAGREGIYTQAPLAYPWSAQGCLLLESAQRRNTKSHHGKLPGVTVYRHTKLLPRPRHFPGCFLHKNVRIHATHTPLM